MIGTVGIGEETEGGGEGGKGRRGEVFGHNNFSLLKSNHYNWEKPCANISFYVKRQVKTKIMKEFYRLFSAFSFLQV